MTLTTTERLMESQFPNFNYSFEKWESKLRKWDPERERERESESHRSSEEESGTKEAGEIKIVFCRLESERKNTKKLFQSLYFMT